jgi:hypothetical protein
MTDQEFLNALETCSFPHSEFGHVGHVRAAYLYLRGGEFVEALTRLRCAIRNYAAFLGNPERYHETIAVAYVALIQQHMYERGHSGGWQPFGRDNPELFQPGLLLRFYSKTQLESGLARRVFLLPHPRLL